MGGRWGRRVRRGGGGWLWGGVGGGWLGRARVPSLLRQPAQGRASVARPGSRELGAGKIGAWWETSAETWEIVRTKER